MQLKTILNRVEPFKSFVYGKVKWVEDRVRPTLEVDVQARKNSRAICSGCDRPRPGYDRLPERRFEFVPLWGIAVYFVYALRRVDCPTCGVTVERVPWAQGKCHLTTMWQAYLNVVAEYLPHVIHVLDRFHIMKKMNDAIDKVRRSEAARLCARQAKA